MAPVRACAAMVVLAPLLLAWGCGGGGEAAPSLLVRREVDGQARLVQVAMAGGEERDVLPGIDGAVGAALVIDAGRAALVTVDRKLWRVELGGRAPVPVPVTPPVVRLDAASRDGRVVSLGDGRLLLLDGEPRIEDLQPPRGEQHRASDVSEDGRRVVLAFGPDCAKETKPWDCRLEIWGFDRDAADAGWRRIAGGATSAYNPRFVPGTGGGELVFERVQADAACPGPWACRKENVVRIAFDGSGERDVRALAWTPRVSPDGRLLAVATMPDHLLAVGPRDGALTTVADDAMWMTAWSADGRWLAYHSFGNSNGTGVVRRDGRGKRIVDGRPIGWIAGALPGTPLAAQPAPRAPAPAPPPTAPGPERPANASFADGAVELVAVAMPETIAAGARFEMILRYRVVRTPPASWKVFVHFDGAGLRFQGDHDPPRKALTWSPGDEIEDRFTVTAGRTAGTYTAFVGFFHGGPDGWQNVSATAATADATSRVRVGTLRVE